VTPHSHTSRKSTQHPRKRPSVGIPPRAGIGGGAGHSR
jgi:hypothetical protein